MLKAVPEWHKAEHTGEVGCFQHSFPLHGRSVPLRAVPGQLGLDTSMFQEIDTHPYGLQAGKCHNEDQDKKKEMVDIHMIDILPQSSHTKPSLSA